MRILAALAVTLLAAVPALAQDLGKPVRLEADGKPIDTEIGHAAPALYDFDGDGKRDLLVGQFGDGLLDLVVGSGNGAVWWYRNAGRKGAPEYAAGVALVYSPGSGHGMESVEHGAAPPRPGLRTKAWVADWDLDGRMDLLVGDYWSEKPAPKELTEVQKTRRDELKKRLSDLRREYGALYEKLGDEAGKDPAVRKLGEELSEAQQELSALEPASKPRGSVWLYLRAPAAK
jgi:hypothetical protein